VRTVIVSVAAALGLLLTQAATAAPRTVDLVVDGAQVLTMDSAGTLIEDGAVAVDKGRIVALGPRAEIHAAWRGKQSLAGADRVVMPGLINGHTHAAMSLLRGIADDLELMDWLTNFIFPTEVRFANADFVRLGTELGCWEMLRGGTTTFVDMYYFPEQVADAVDHCGIRALVGSTVIDHKSPDSPDVATSFAQARAFVAHWKGRNNRVIPTLAPHAIYTLQAQQLQATRALATELGVPVTIHLSESQSELDMSREKYRATPINALESLGFFSGPTIGAHVIWPQDDEIPLLAKRGVGAIHNPTSNMKIAAGISPVTKLLEAGVAVGLGTDGAATNNDLDLWEEMRLAAFLQKVHTMNPTSVPARTALTMATSGGARAIGLGNEIGSLAVGMRADLIQVSLEDLHFTPMYDLVSHLVYVADEQDVVSVVVDGRIVVRERKVLTVDAARLRRDAEAMAARIRAALAADKAAGSKPAAS
jgi:5-methylthioadenosine/S-adenosylhomocysteine deaminase